MRLETDILVIGSGIAGLSFALKAAKKHKVLIVTKKEQAESNTNYAQGGIATVTSPDDSYELHIKDTLECGAGLCHTDAVEQIVKNGPHLINELIELGVNFSREQGKLDLGREGGHSRQRIVHAKDLTGKEIERALLHNITNHKNITVLEHHTAIDLITEHNIKKRKPTGNINCYGAYAYDEMNDEIYTILSDLTVICTGGIGQVYLHTTNPAIATGDGIAIGYRSGCKIGNMEFVQFHPTSLYENKINPTDGQSFLISEALRGAGAILKTKNGEEFMFKYDSRGSLAPRDIVARAIDSEMKKHGDDFVYLDITKLGEEKIKNKFPYIYKKCLSIGINMAKDMIPVVPAAHYSCGGIVSDLDGRTSMNRLFVLGEASMTGVHGANRLASNSLLEALVYADKAAKICCIDPAKTKRSKIKIPDWDSSGTENAEEWVLISQNKYEIKQIMSNYVGIVRSNLRLHRALRRITLIKDEIETFYKKTRVNRELLELRNMVLISYLIIRSALMRKESRGLHYSTDYPETKRSYLKDTVITNKTVK
ncbi:MAG TPA: L-aspartate oxidase [Ignavibacteria bacterium]|nr:L-aspartate oxidase [Ignavibacteria bacterium]